MLLWYITLIYRSAQRITYKIKIWIFTVKSSNIFTASFQIWKTGSCFITHRPAALSRRRHASTAKSLGMCDTQVNIRGKRFSQILLWISRTVKGEMSKIYCHRFTVVFPPRKELQDERHKEREKEKGKGRKTIRTQTKEFQKHQYNWICRFAGLWMNQYLLCLVYLGLAFLLNFFAVGDLITEA